MARITIDGWRSDLGISIVAQCAVEGTTKRFDEAARLGRMVSRNPEARAKHRATRRRHAEACSTWDPSTQPAWLTPELFSEKIQPLLVALSYLLGALPRNSATLPNLAVGPAHRHESHDLGITVNFFRGMVA